jgi:hypothetical protein
MTFLRVTTQEKNINYLEMKKKSLKYEILLWLFIGMPNGWFYESG